MKAVVRVADVDRIALTRLLLGFGLQLRLLGGSEPIPGSYWGESEAGLKGGTLFARTDTPLHSVLHEACHYICMTPERRTGLDTDAGGNDVEETAVCYLQALLADAIPGFGREKLFADMDAWGYSFRLGSAARWFAEDAGDARAWLQERGVIDALGRPTGRLRC